MTSNQNTGGGDPFDYSRSVIAEHADRAAIYADHLRDMISLRDDAAAIHAMQRLVFEVRSANEALKLVTAENNRRRAEAAISNQQEVA